MGSDAAERLYDLHRSMERFDPAVIVVDAEPVEQWYFRARREEIDALLRATPITPPSSLVACVFEDGGFGVQRSPEPFAGACVTLYDHCWNEPLAACVLPTDDAGKWTGTVGLLPLGWPDQDWRIAKLVACMLAMFHVKNIGMREVQYPRTVRRRHEREAGVAGPRAFHILTVRRIESARGRSAATGREMPMHGVRGNFATYYDSAPMFGLYTGTFFRPQHERGNPDLGRSDKAYRIKPRKQV